MKNLSILFFLSIISSNLFSQANNGAIKGKVIDSKTNQGVPFASIAVWGTTTGVITDQDGNFTFSGLKPGFTVLHISSIGFKPYVSEGMMVTNSKTVNIDILLEESELQIGEVVIKPSPFRKSAESPVSEGEIKARYEKTIIVDNGFRFNFGAGMEYAHYRNSTYNKIFNSNSTGVIDYSTNLKFGKYGIFGQVSKSLLDKKLTLSFGIRTDANNYSTSMANPVSQISPRFSASYALTGKLNLNMNLGRYYELPPYTALGFANNYGVLVNKSDNLKYIRSDHLITGIEYIPIENIQLSIEGFYKHYIHYPFSVRDSVPISSKGADYGIFGNEELKSFSQGQAYGVEFRKIFT